MSCACCWRGSGPTFATKRRSPRPRRGIILDGVRSGAWRILVGQAFFRFIYILAALILTYVLMIVLLILDVIA